MPKTFKIIFITIITLFLLLVILYTTGLLRGYYYDTHMYIGDKKVYSYNEITFSKLKCMNHIYFYEDDNYKYYLDKSGCAKEQYYIKVDRKYVNIPEALELHLITPLQILESNLNITKEDK